MKIEFKGRAHKHDLVHVECKFCDTIVKFWRGEPGTTVDYVNQADNEDIFNVYWTCPVCGRETSDQIGDYRSTGLYGVGMEHDHVMSKEEKEEMEAAMQVKE